MVMDEREKAAVRNTVIVTATLYKPDNEIHRMRARLAGRMIRTAVDKGYKFIVVDGGSSDEDLRDFERYGADVHTCQQSGGRFGPGRRESFRLGYLTGKKVIAWTEPEKEPYVSEIPKVSEPILEEKADLVLPERASLVSYPVIQQAMEPLSNDFFRLLTGLDIDVWFGSRSWSRDVNSHFANYGGKYGDKWDSIFVPMIDIIKAGKRVIGVEIDYTHPAEQKEVEDRNMIHDFLRRLDQHENINHSMELRWKEITIQEIIAQYYR